MTTSPHSRRRIFLMRHGSVTYFDDSGKPFLPESVALNEQGCAQASAAGRVFAEHRVRFDRVIVSGLARTVETARRVLAETGQDIAIDCWPELEEIRGGRLSTIADADLRDAFTGVFEGLVSADKRFLGGESVGDLMDRIHPAIARLRADPDWDTVLLVLHGGVNCAILSLALTGRRRPPVASTRSTSARPKPTGWSASSTTRRPSRCTAIRARRRWKRCSPSTRSRDEYGVRSDGPDPGFATAAGQIHPEIIVRPFHSIG
jgi:broad specificity phosphatase PhoE